MDQTLLNKALDVNWRNLALGHEVFEAEGAVFVRNTAYPSIYDANFIYNVTASTPDEIDSLVARAEREYTHASNITFRIDLRTPTSFQARLALANYETQDSLLMVLEGELRGTPKPFEIRPIATEDDWEAFAELTRADWRETAPKVNEDPNNVTIADGLSGTNRLKSPPVHFFLAYADGEPRAFFNAWEGTAGVGQVENLFTHPDYRHRGMATALLHHCVADARAHGAGPVVIVCHPPDTPKNMYAALGWRPFALNRQFTKKRAG
jgi:GNAT superfamily N-acetyltransferase